MNVLCSMCPALLTRPVRLWDIVIACSSPVAYTAVARFLGPETVPKYATEHVSPMRNVMAIVILSLYDVLGSYCLRS